jgi:hypothetical protein
LLQKETGAPRAVAKGNVIERQVEIPRQAAVTGRASSQPIPMQGRGLMIVDTGSVHRTSQTDTVIQASDLCGDAPFVTRPLGHQHS